MLKNDPDLDLCIINKWYSVCYSILQAGADKLKWEMETYGFPPVFPVEKQEEKSEEKEFVIKDKTKGKKVGVQLINPEFLK